ncbi:hypothetical protein CCP3SC1_410026 [Gammaproteobacteria bacterium]
MEVSGHVCFRGKDGGEEEPSRNPAFRTPYQPFSQIYPNLPIGSFSAEFLFHRGGPGNGSVFTG